MTYFTVASNVRSTINDDGGVLLDLDSGVVFSLNAVGARVCAMLQQGLTLDSILESLADEFRVPRQQLLSDIATFLLQLESRGLVRKMAVGRAMRNVEVGVPSAPSPQGTIGENKGAGKPPANKERRADNGEGLTGRAAPKASDTFLAFLGLVAVDLITKVKGFPYLYRIVKSFPVSHKQYVDPTTVARVCVAVDRACICYPKRALCLHRSALATCLLRRQGVAARMVIACRVMPYHGHAWVEVDGEVVNDSNKVQEFYSVLENL